MRYSLANLETVRLEVSLFTSSLISNGSSISYVKFSAVEVVLLARMCELGAAT
jgi:hypothetical protein